MLARCPTCRNTFSTDRTGRQDCPSCGKPLVVPEQPPPAPGSAPVPSGPAPAAGALPPPASPPPLEGAGTPWERRGTGPGEIPAFKAWLDTLFLALFEPGKLFSMVRIEDRASHLKFALWTGSIFWFIGQLLEKLMMTPTRELLQKLLSHLPQAPPPWLMNLIDSGNQNNLRTTVLVGLLTPLVVFVFIYAQAGITHLAALLLGQNKRGFAATFAAAAYGLSPIVLFAIPGCGQLIGIVWIVVLTGIGLKHTHGMSVGGAVGAALSPYLLLCCFSCVLLMAAISLFAPSISQLGG